MNIPTKTISLFASAALLSLSSLSAQVQTAPVGYVTVTIPAGLSALSIPMQKSPAYTGALTGVTGDVLSCSIASVPEGFYYVQVIESTGAAGKVATVTSITPGTINITPAIPSLTSGDRIVVRPHFTLSDFYADPEFSDGSTLTVYTANGGKESFEYISSGTLGTANGVWANQASEDASAVAVLPSEGFVFSNSSTEKKVVVTGAVPVDAVSVELGSSFSVIGSNSPISSTTISTVFADLAIGSTIAVYSADGLLTLTNSYEVVNSADLGLGEGKTFVRDGEFLGDDDTIPAGSGVVVSPAAGTGLLVPAAYSSN